MKNKVLKSSLKVLIILMITVVGRLSMAQEYCSKVFYPDLRTLKESKYNITNSQKELFYPNMEVLWPSQVYKINLGFHWIEIIIPMNVGYENLSDSVIQTIMELPIKRIENLRVVRVNLPGNKADYTSNQFLRDYAKIATCATRGEMDIFPVNLANFKNSPAIALRITRIEFARLIAEQIFGSRIPNESYINSAIKDSHRVSDYERNAWAMDFVEGVELYIRTNAGQFSPDAREQLRNRFEFFDDIFNYRTPQSFKKNSREHLKLLLNINKIAEDKLLIIAPEIGIGVLFKIN